MSDHTDAFLMSAYQNSTYTFKEKNVKEKVV